MTPKQLPQNFPFYDWVPKPLGIIFLILLFIPLVLFGYAILIFFHRRNL